jgi:myo-inositol-1(or 4)-monophosphatase
VNAAQYDDDEVGRRFAAAESIAKRAGERALRYFEARGDLAISHKAAQDRVSEADREVEALIREAVAAQFPEDAFLGEEHGAAEGRSGFLWVVDPIDGTTPFLSGLPDWCVSIAVAAGGGPLIGAIHAPRLGETFVGVRGGGAFVNGRRLALDASAGLGDGMFAFGGSLKCDPAETGDFVRRLMRAGGMAFHNGSGALMLSYVADGRLVGYYDARIMPWDCFAGLVLVAEAGGKVDYAAPADFGAASMLVGAPPAFAAAQALLAAQAVSRS